MSGERNVAATQTETLVEVGPKVVYKVLAAISVCHLLNDMLSSLLPAIYPLLKSSFNLNFAQVGLITLTYQTTASLLQPVVARKLVERFGEMARQGGLVEALTEREVDVLQSVASGLRNKEIAFDLGLSESTIKTHLASIFGKLNVTTRTEAVARGRELGIIAL